MPLVKFVGMRAGHFPAFLVSSALVMAISPSSPSAESPAILVASAVGSPASATCTSRRNSPAPFRPRLGGDPRAQWLSASPPRRRSHTPPSLWNDAVAAELADTCTLVNFSAFTPKNGCVRSHCHRFRRTDKRSGRGMARHNCSIGVGLGTSRRWLRRPAGMQKLLAGSPESRLLTEQRCHSRLRRQTELDRHPSDAADGGIVSGALGTHPVGEPDGERQ